VDEVGDEVDSMKKQLAAQRQRSASISQKHPGYDEEAASGADQDNYAEFEQQEQVRIMADQDQALDGVFRTVGTLRQQADEMGRELEEQAEMIEHVDNLADRVGGKLANGMQKVNWVIRKNEDAFSSCCIAVLIFVLILLLILLLIL
jgi:uncharacterized coiled-coil DUF342 family protein